MRENLKGDSKSPGCRCPTSEDPDMRDKIMGGGINGCPWHGLGTVGISHLEIDGLQYSITGGPREVLVQCRNELDFGAVQVVLLRWRIDQQLHHLMWVLGHTRRTNRGIQYTPPSLQLESLPQTSSLYAPKTILKGEKLSGLLLARNAEKISQEANLPREVIETMAGIYTPSNTYYLRHQPKPAKEA